MNKNNICIATITLARDEKEEQLLRESLQQLAALQLPVFITDGGSLPGFLDFLKSFPHFTVTEAKVKGVWEQAKNSLFLAHQSGSEFIFYTEPDKYDFFRLSLPDLLEQVETGEQSGVILASRSSAGFSTFPGFQQMTETTINNCCAQVIGEPFEYTYGPFLLNTRLVPYLTLVEKDIGWGWRPYVFGIAKRLGYKVESYAGDFLCPSQQREDTGSERIYRMRQLQQNIDGIVLSTTVDLTSK